jgi:hypothetical protein
MGWLAELAGPGRVFAPALRRWTSVLSAQKPSRNLLDIGSLPSNRNIRLVVGQFAE